MIRKPSDTQAVGLHLDGLTLKLVEVDVVRNQVKVKRLEEFLLKKDDEEHLHFLDEGEGRICRELCDKHLMITSLDGKETLIRKLKIKLTREKDVEEAFPFEAEGALPYPMDEAIIDKITIDKDEDTTYLTLLACKKTSLESFLAKFHTLKLDPESVSCTPAALSAFAARYTATEGDLVVVFCGEETSLSAVVRAGKLISSHSLSAGTKSLKTAYEKDLQRDPELLPAHLQNFDFLSDDLLIAPHLNEAVTALKHEISWMILSELKGMKTSIEPPLLFLGEASTLKGLDKLLFKEVPCQHIELQTTDGIELNQNLLKKFAIAIGSALSALPGYADPLNFRQGDLSYPDPWRRFKGSLIIFAGSSLLLSLLIFLFGFAFLGYQEDLLRTKYGELLSGMHRSYSGFEKNYIEKYPRDAREDEGETPTLKSLSMESLDNRLNYIDKEIKAQPDLYPLLPNSPLVSDTLAWLVSHPAMKTEEGNITLDSFAYQMVKRPEMTKKNERYQIKVDLEISAPTPKMAREFHSALIAPNNFVDPKAEVKWSASRNKYQTSFYLKDKTVYLPGAK